MIKKILVVLGVVDICQHLLKNRENTINTKVLKLDCLSVSIAFHIFPKFKIDSITSSNGSVFFTTELQLRFRATSLDSSLGPPFTY